MSTNSTITLRRAPAAHMSTYAHWNGKPSFMGRVLLEHYTDPMKIEQLISLGCLSLVRAEVGDPTISVPDSPNSITTIAYHRDRGEEFMAPGLGPTPLEAIADGPYGEFEEYNYLFTEGAWRVASFHFKRKDGTPSPRFHMLTDVLASADPDNYDAA